MKSGANYGNLTSMAAKVLTVISHDEKTYEVHLELKNPPRKAVGGQSLNEEHLRTELRQHGCVEAQINQALQQLEETRKTVIEVA